MKKIYLTQSQITFVSDEDYDYLMQWNWCINQNNGKSYAVRGRRENYKNIKIYMHHVVIKRIGLIVPKGYIRDHEDRNSLNNQRYNLRVTTQSINCHNQEMFITNTSGVKGVSYHKVGKKWVAYIDIHASRITLGYYDRFEDAVQVRLKAEQLFLKEGDKK